MSFGGDWSASAAVASGVVWGNREEFVAVTPILSDAKVLDRAFCLYGQRLAVDWPANATFGTVKTRGFFRD